MSHQRRVDNNSRVDASKDSHSNQIRSTDGGGNGTRDYSFLLLPSDGNLSLGGGANGN